MKDLAGVVLVGKTANGGIGFAVAKRAQELAHVGVAGDVLDEGAVGSKGVAQHDIVVIGRATLVVGDGAVAIGNHEYLGEGEGNALTEGIGVGVGAHGLAPKGLDAVLGADAGIDGAVAAGDGELGLPLADEGEVEVYGAGELGVDPGGEAEGADASELVRSGAEGCLLKEASRGFLGGFAIGGVGDGEGYAGLGAEGVARAGLEGDGDGLVTLGDGVGDRSEVDADLVGPERDGSGEESGGAVVAAGGRVAAERETHGDRGESAGAANDNDAGVGPVLGHGGIGGGDGDGLGGASEQVADALEVSDARIVGSRSGGIAPQALGEHAHGAEANGVFLPVAQQVAVAIHVGDLYTGEKPGGGGRARGDR